MIDKDRIHQIHQEIDAALGVIAKKHNLVIVRSYIGYESDNFRLTATFGDKAEVGENNPIFIKNLRRHGPAFGLDTTDLGKKFVTRQGEFEVLGMRGRNVVAKRTDGQLYSYDPHTVAGLLGKKPFRDALVNALGGR